MSLSSPTGCYTGAATRPLLLQKYAVHWLSAAGSDFIVQPMQSCWEMHIQQQRSGSSSSITQI